MSFDLHLWPNDKITLVEMDTYARLDGYQQCQCCTLTPLEYAAEVEVFQRGHHHCTSFYEFVSERIAAINLGRMAQDYGWKPE